MRAKINLASQPYENARRFFLQWGLALVALLAVSGLLVYAAVKSWRVSHSLSRSIAEEHARLEKLNEQEKKDLELLNLEQNRDVRERSQALNALILRKQFSWTRIFSNLESIMPARLHLVAITPQLNVNDQIEVRLQVAGDSRDKAIELVLNMEKTPDFRDPWIISETLAPKGSAGDPVSFEITAFYVPAPVTPAAKSNKEVTPAETQPQAPGSSSSKAESREPKAESPATNDQQPATGERRPKGGAS